MDISKEIGRLGLRKLPKTLEVSGFSGKIITILSEEAQSTLSAHFKLDALPDISILSNGVITREGYGYARSPHANSQISFLLLCYNRDCKKLIKCTTNKIPFPKVQASIGKLLIIGDNFTARKHFEEWKKRITN